jgi:hypothetical protein
MRCPHITYSFNWNYYLAEASIGLWCMKILRFGFVAFFCFNIGNFAMGVIELEICN